jgi:hypothetical protein
LKKNCHQVYAKTRGQALILNDLIFRGNGPQTGLAVFREFHTTSKALHCAPERIHIFDSDDFSRAPEDWHTTLYRFIDSLKQPGFLSLKAFASCHPSMRILVHLKYRPKSYPQLDRSYESLRQVLRGPIVPGTGSYQSSPTYIAHMVSEMRNGLESAGVDLILPNNLRFVFDLELGSQHDVDSCRIYAGTCKNRFLDCDWMFRLVRKLYADGC